MLFRCTFPVPAPGPQNASSVGVEVWSGIRIRTIALSDAEAEGVGPRRGQPCLCPSICDTPGGLCMPPPPASVSSSVKGRVGLDHRQGPPTSAESPKATCCRSAGHVAPRFGGQGELLLGNGALPGVGPRPGSLGFLMGFPGQETRQELCGSSVKKSPVYWFAVNWQMGILKRK